MSDRIRVLHMVSWYHSITDPNPIPTFHAELCNELNKLCDVAIYYPYERNMTEEFSKMEEFGITTYRSAYKLEKKARNRLYMYRAMKRIIEDFHPDIIHGHVATEAGRFATGLGKIFSIPVIITEHSSADLSGVRKFPHHQYAWLSYKLSRYNACVSDALRNDLSEIFPKYQFHTIYNGIIIPDDIENHIKNSRDYRVADSVNMIMVAGMYDEHIKGIDMLIPALRKVKESGHKVVMHFVGDGDYRLIFEELAKKEGVSDICIFHGWKNRKDVLTIVSQMDFLISTSRFESFGCSMAEAVMMGTPVLATDSGGSRSIVSDDNGMFIDGYDSYAIYDGICKMISKYTDFDANVFRPNAIEKFSIANEGKQYISIYKKIIE